MNEEEVASAIETELAWRFDEYRSIKNLGAELEDEDSRAPLRKALVLLLYSHLEGYSKNVLRIYVEALNGERLQLKQVRRELAAAGARPMFDVYQRDEVNYDPLPEGVREDERCRRVFRRAIFMSAITSAWNNQLEISAEEVLDTESNLGPDVLRALLFHLGLDTDYDLELYAALKQLLKHRNGLAHGETRSAPTNEQFQWIEERILKLFREVKKSVLHAVRTSSHLLS